MSIDIKTLRKLFSASRIGGPRSKKSRHHEKEQREMERSIGPLAFQRIVKQITDEMYPGHTLRIQRSALDLLQRKTELYMESVMKGALENTESRGSDTVSDIDIHPLKRQPAAEENLVSDETNSDE